MELEKEREIFRKAWKKWGEQAQLMMLAEECAELTKAALKIGRTHNSMTDAELAEEMADVEIMIRQVSYMLDLGVLRLVSYDEKIKRLEEMTH